MKLIELKESVKIYKIQKITLGVKLDSLKKELLLISEKKKPLEQEKLKIEEKYSQNLNEVTSLETNFKQREKKLSQIKIVIGIIVFYAVYYATESDKTQGELILLVLGLYGLINFIFSKLREVKNNKKIKPLKKEQESLTSLYNIQISQLEPVESKFQNLDLEISATNKSIRNLDMYIKNSEILENIKQKFDKDDNLKLDLIESTHIDGLIESSQVRIREIEKSEGKSYIPDIVKINLFLNDFQKSLSLEFKNIHNSYKSDDYSKLVDIFLRDLSFYKVLTSNLILMIRNLTKDNLIGYYKIYDVFDKLSIFETNFERKMISELIGLKNTTRELIEISLQNKDEIIDELSQLNVSLYTISDDIQGLQRSLLK